MYISTYESKHSQILKHMQLVLSLTCICTCVATYKVNACVCAIAKLPSTIYAANGFYSAMFTENIVTNILGYYWLWPNAPVGMHVFMWFPRSYYCQCVDRLFLEWNLIT